MSTIAEPIRLLLLTANPTSTYRLALDREVKAIEQKISKHPHQFELFIKRGVTFPELQDALYTHRPHIVHFGGHASQNHEIFLHTEDEGDALVHANDLAKLLGSFNEVRLVVLNACSTDVIARAVANTVGCAIGMTQTITDETARFFVESFYLAIRHGSSVQQAYTEGCSHLNSRCSEQASAPQLYTHKDLIADQIVLVADQASHGHSAPQGRQRDRMELREERPPTLRKSIQLSSGDYLGDGRYQLLTPIGSGRFAVVWKALDRHKGQDIAVKVLNSQRSGDPSLREQFLRGARAMARLKHDAIARVSEPVSENGLIDYFVMELLTGGDLRKTVLKMGQGDSRSTLRWIVTLGEALMVAHAADVLHLDVNPRNILFTESRAPKLTDFALLRAADIRQKVSAGSNVAVSFMAPELAEDHHEVSGRIDVYGLGMTAIFALHGKNLPVRLDSAIAELPVEKALKNVLKRAVSSRRYSDMQKFCEKLRSAMSEPTDSIALHDLLEQELD